MSHRQTISPLTCMSWVSTSGVRDVAEDTLTRYRRVLGRRPPDALTSANNLAAHLRALDEYDQAINWKIGSDLISIYLYAPFGRSSTI